MLTKDFYKGFTKFFIVHGLNYHRKNLVKLIAYKCYGFMTTVLKIFGVREFLVSKKSLMKSNSYNTPLTWHSSCNTIVVRVKGNN